MEEIPPVTELFPIIKGKTPSSWSMLIYGTPGCGKSSLGAQAPKPFFLDLEDGLSRIDGCERSPVLRNWAEVHRWLGFAFKTQDYQTIVIDTLDAMEGILTQKILASHRDKVTLSDFGYGKGHDILEAEWLKVLGILGQIKATGKNILLIGHEQIQKFEDPSSENYDRFNIKVHRKSASIITAKMDAVLFARYEVFFKEKEGTKKKRAAGTGERLLHTVEAPCWVAKNRFGLPDIVPMDAELFSKLN